MRERLQNPRGSLTGRMLRAASPLKLLRGLLSLPNESLNRIFANKSPLTDLHARELPSRQEFIERSQPDAQTKRSDLPAVQ
jgi:hypothetical protein